MEDSITRLLLKFKQFDPDDITHVTQNTSIETFKKGDLVLKESVIEIIGRYHL